MAAVVRGDGCARVMWGGPDGPRALQKLRMMCAGACLAR
ncbi:hypothetical protein DA2_2520 [Desulfovibrio sp. A2]|nr:hypothetical protein DA2_2520 [Desulfovibrio sp. A2]